MRIDTWIDVQQLGQLDESIGVIAYHVVQEGLTNVRRHAPGAPVSLQVDANPPQGVHVHVSNPTMPQSPSHMADTRKGPVFLVWPNAYSRLAEHANTV